MKRNFLIYLFLLVSINYASAQNQNIKDLYWDYTTVRMEKTERSKAIALASDLLKRSSELNSKEIANVTYHLGRLYEESNQLNLAIPLYEKSILLTPGYYVPYLALGNIYFKDCKDLVVKMNQAADANDSPRHNKLKAEYNKLATKTASYLERSYSCDPDELTLSMITYLYKTLKDETAIKTLDERIKKFADSCITLLDDE